MTLRAAPSPLSCRRFPKRGAIYAVVRAAGCSFATKQEKVTDGCNGRAGGGTKLASGRLICKKPNLRENAAPAHGSDFVLLIVTESEAL